LFSTDPRHAANIREAAGVSAIRGLSLPLDPDSQADQGECTPNTAGEYGAPNSLFQRWSVAAAYFFDTQRMIAERDPLGKFNHNSNLVIEVDQ